MTDGLLWDHHPALDDPVMVAAFEGWNDAGDAATGAADWLVHNGGGERFASITPDAHIDYQSHRPHVELVDGVATAISWPANEFWVARFAERDLVVLRGIEPNVCWKGFCDSVLAVAAATSCSMVVTLGALLGDTPHTRAVRVTGTATDPDLVARLDLAQSRYEGPTGIVGVLHDACRVAGVPSASLWAPVPHYVATPPNPPATRALLGRLAGLTGVPLDLDGIDQLVDLWRAQVDHAIADNDEVKDYVRELESRIDVEDAEERGIVLGDHPAGSGTVPSADELADEVERFLREHDEGG